MPRGGSKPHTTPGTLRMHCLTFPKMAFCSDSNGLMTLLALHTIHGCQVWFMGCLIGWIIPIGNYLNCLCWY